MVAQSTSRERFRAITRHNIAQTEHWKRLPEQIRAAILVVSTVLPFRTNSYVMDALINWERVPHDPMFNSRSLIAECSLTIIIGKWRSCSLPMRRPMLFMKPPTAFAAR